MPIKEWGKTSEFQTHPVYFQRIWIWKFCDAFMTDKNVHEPKGILADQVRLTMRTAKSISGKWYFITTINYIRNLFIMFRFLFYCLLFLLLLFFPFYLFLISSFQWFLQTPNIFIIFTSFFSFLLLHFDYVKFVFTNIIFSPLISFFHFSKSHLLSNSLPPTYFLTFNFFFRSYISSSFFLFSICLRFLH